MVNNKENKKYQKQKLKTNFQTLFEQIDKSFEIFDSGEYQSINPLITRYNMFLDKAKELYPDNEMFANLLDFPEEICTESFQVLNMNVEFILDNIEFDECWEENKKLKKENTKLKVDLKKHSSYTKIK